MADSTEISLAPVLPTRGQGPRRHENWNENKSTSIWYPKHALSFPSLKLWGSRVHGLEKELHPARARRACEQDALRCLPGKGGLQSADNANFRGIECIFIPKGSPFAAAAAAALVVALLARLHGPEFRGQSSGRGREAWHLTGLNN